MHRDVRIHNIHIKREGIEVLSPLERQVLSHLWKAKSAKARDIHRKLGNKDAALTSVAVMLDRLHKKKLVTRKIGYARGGAYYVYSPSLNERDFHQSIVETTVNKLIDKFGSVAVNYFDERFAVRSAKGKRKELHVLEEQRRSSGYRKARFSKIAPKVRRFV
jgi:predicted transcriptional regulator